MRLGAVEVSACDAVAADVELARNADGDRLHSGVEDVDLGVGDGPADGDGPSAGLDLGGSGPDGGFGGTVEVPEHIGLGDEALGQVRGA